MSMQNVPQFNPQHRRWYHLEFNYQSNRWEPVWMPIGWSPSQEPPVSPPSTSNPHPPSTPRTYVPPPVGAIGVHLNHPELSPPPDYQHQINFTGAPSSIHAHPIGFAPSHGLVPKTGKGLPLHGQFNPRKTPSDTNPDWEPIDPAYFVRNRAFFHEGKVFAVILSENAGTTITSYNSSISQVKYKGHYVHTQTRRFVVVRQRREFCYACPIFTYQGKGTTKRGVRPEEHGVAYTMSQAPQLLPSEVGITKASIGVHMAGNEPSLHIASRIYYGIHHPIQYNVRVKEIGSVEKTHIPTLIGNWKAEDGGAGTRQAPEVTAAAGDPELPGVDEEDQESEVEQIQEVENVKGKAPVSQQIDPYLYHPQNNQYGYDPDRYPHSYHPKANPYGYHPHTYPQGYHPEVTPFSYHPKHNPDGYHAQASPYSYHPVHNLQGYHFKKNSYLYHPKRNPHGWHPQANPHAYHQQKNPYGFHPHTSPYIYAYHPEHNEYGYHHQWAPKGYHPEYNPAAYHPKYNNPYGNVEQASGAGDEQQGEQAVQYQSESNPGGYQQGGVPRQYQQTYDTMQYSQGPDAAQYQQASDPSQHQHGDESFQCQQGDSSIPYQQEGSSIQYQQSSSPVQYLGSGTDSYQEQSGQADQNAQLSSLMEDTHLR